MNFTPARTKEKQVEHVLLSEYNRYYRLAFSYVHNEADACDIVQNGAYKAIRASKNLKNIEYAGTWVYRIMLNEIFRFGKEPKHISLEDVEETGYEERYEDLDLRRALDQLSREDKAVVELKFFEDMKLEEIAEILDENLNTVKSRLYRSIKKLRTVLADKQEQETEQNRKVGR